MSRKNRNLKKVNWKGVQAGILTEIPENARIHGHVSANHASTIVKTRVNRKTKRPYYDYVGSTHNLSEKTQASIAKKLDNPNVTKVYLYDAE